MIRLIMTIHDDSHLSQTVRKFEIRQESIVFFLFFTGSQCWYPRVGDAQLSDEQQTTGKKKKY